MRLFVAGFATLLLSLAFAVAAEAAGKADLVNGIVDGF
jgi:hypothetical protein